MRRVGLSREEGERLVHFGAVYQEHGRVSSDQPVTTGQYIRVHVDPKRFPVEDVDWPATIVHQQEIFLVVNKPAGVPVHATVDNRVENVLHQLSTTLGGPLYITQRLDAEVGGLMVIGRTPEFQREFNRLLVDRKVKKIYRALVTVCPPVGRYVHFMRPEPRSPKTVSATPRADWLECALRVIRVNPAQFLNGTFEAEIHLETGRTHQIRAQLSAMGSPIVGDALYGAAAASNIRGIGLFSVSVNWPSPDGRDWRFELKTPWAD